jgi:ribosomal protein S16
MVVIRLSRGGSKGRPFFNIVVADKAYAPRRPLHRAHWLLQPDRHAPTKKASVSLKTA